MVYHHFEKHFILTVHNLYNYHCFLETFKILKHRAPFPLFNNYQNSRRKYLTYIQLIPPLPSNNFTYRSSIIWNYIRPKLELNDISTSTSSVKSNLRQMLHTNQHNHHKVEWLPSLDHNVSKLNWINPSYPPYNGRLLHTKIYKLSFLINNFRSRYASTGIFISTWLMFMTYINL